MYPLGNIQLYNITKILYQHMQLYKLNCSLPLLRIFYYLYSEENGSDKPEFYGFLFYRLILIFAL